MSLANGRVRKRYKTNLPEQQMACEMNYHRLLSLVTELASAPVASSHTYAVGGGSTVSTIVEIRVEEQTKYTTVVHIVQYSSLQKKQCSIKTSGSQNSNKPLGLLEQKGIAMYQADVRLYHDASLAEVVKCQRYHEFKPRYEYPNNAMHQIDEKAQLNRFLGELLTHCLRHGRVYESVVDTLFFQSTHHN